MSSGLRSSPRNRSKATPSVPKNLLKTTLTKTMTSMSYLETPDTSANSTDTGIRRAKAQFELLNKETPRTVLAEKLPNQDKNTVNSDDLFNAAKEATRARREKLGRPVTKKKSLVVSPSKGITTLTVEEENFNPQILQSPAIPRNKLKRKSRLVRNRRNTQDDESHQDEDVEEDDSANDMVVQDNVSEHVLPKTLKRRATRSAATAIALHSLSADQIEQEASIEDSLDAKL